METALFSKRDACVLLGEYGILFAGLTMNIAREIAKFEEAGFTRERAEVNALMEQALVSIFKDFPDAYVLMGGASLVLYHESTRHSADLDLLARKAVLPSCQEVRMSLERDLVPMGR